MANGDKYDLSDLGASQSDLSDLGATPVSMPAGSYQAKKGGPILNARTALQPSIETDPEGYALAQSRKKLANIIPNEEAYRQDPRLRNVTLPAGVSPSDVAANENQYMKQSGQFAGTTAGAMATGGLFPVIRGAGVAPNLLRFGGRVLASGAGTGTGALVGGASPAEAKSAAISGAAFQPLAEGTSALLSKVAPPMAESALKVSERMRGRGRTIGQAVLENTQGVRPSTLAAQAKSQISDLTSQMEDAVHQATQSGVTGSSQPAHDVLNNAISSLPRNARTIRDKLASLHDLLDLDQSGRTQFTPDELLEMKRGIGQEIQSWPPEWQRMSAVQQVKQRLYGALDNELDNLVPGNSDLNQKISSLIPARQQAMRLSDQAGVMQRIAGRVAAHTGALAGAGIGGFLGYREGGPRGALVGSALGLGVPEFLASPTTQMILARSASGGGRLALSPYLLALEKSLISQQPRNQRNNAQE
jgi:hypothetical protein